MALAHLTINLDAFTGDDHPPVPSYSTITLDPGADHIDAASDVIHVRSIVVSLDRQGKAATANGVPCVDGRVPVVAGVAYAVSAPNILRGGPHYIPALTAGQVVDLSDYITPGAPLTPDQAATLTARIVALEETPPDHGALTGLGDDDHPQYLTTGRGDERYVQGSDSRLTLADTAVQPADLTGVGAPAAGQTLGALLDIGVGATALTVLGDSTGNDWFEWPQRLCNAMGEACPDLTIRHALWDNGTQAYGAPTTIHEGSNPPGEVTTVVTLVDDQFDRVAAELIGSTPDEGAVWQGTTGRFSLDGSEMSGIPGLAHTYPSPAHASGPGPVTVTASVTMNQASSGVLKTVEVGAKAVDVNSHVFVTMSVPTGGGRTWALWKRIGGVATKLTDGTTDASFTSKTISVSLTVDGADVSATVDGETITGTLTGGDVTALTSGWGVVLWLKTDATGVSVDFITATTTSVSMTDGYTLTVYNGSMPGSTLAYQQARVADMVPAETSTVILSSSHNYGTTGAGDYLTAVRDFIAALTAARPFVDVIASSQNPQFAPRTAEQIEAHAIRCGALRGEAFRLGWGYWPVYEKWTQLAGGGAAWVNADGLHPRYDVTGVNDGGTFWASVALDYVARLALVDAG
jgi:hypothetical protein